MTQRTDVACGPNSSWGAERVKFSHMFVEVSELQDFVPAQIAYEVIKKILMIFDPTKNHMHVAHIQCQDPWTAIEEMAEIYQLDRTSIGSMVGAAYQDNGLSVPDHIPRLTSMQKEYRKDQGSMPSSSTAAASSRTPASGLRREFVDHSSRPAASGVKRERSSEPSGGKKKKKQRWVKKESSPSPRAGPAALIKFKNVRIKISGCRKS